MNENINNRQHKNKILKNRNEHILFTLVLEIFYVR